MSKGDLEKKLLLIMLAGEIMMKNGAETYRAENTMEWFGKNLNIKTEAFVTLTGIFLTVEDDLGNSLSRVARIDERVINLHKVSEVNTYSRSEVFKTSTLEESIAYLQKIEESKEYYPKLLIYFAAGIASACFAVLFGGTFYDMAPAFVAGVCAQIALEYFTLHGMVRFGSSFMGGAIVAVIGILLAKLHPAIQEDKVIIAGIMPLVPGLAITNAARDLVSDHLLAGLSRGGEALIIATGIAAGVAVIFLL